MSTQTQQQEIVELDIDDVDMVQYLTFQLDGEAFATEIDNVREVLEHTKITRVPRTPEYMLGVINLRGSVVPVVDLRLQFGMPVSEHTVDTCIIIIEVEIKGALTVLGALADSVQEVVNLLPDQLSPPPTLGTRIDNQYISAMGKVDEGFVIILKLDMLFNIDSEMFTSLADLYHSNQIEQIKNQEFDKSANDEIINDLSNEAETKDTASDVKESDKKVEVGIDLGSAIQAHAQWKLKLHTAIKKKDKLNDHEISRDDCCMLGKWLHCEAKSNYKDLHAYSECLRKHKAFHVEAGKVAKAINSELYERAEAMLDSNTPYASVSKSVAAAIVSLRKEIE